MPARQLHVTEQDGVVLLDVPRPAAGEEALDDLAREFLDVSAAVLERVRPVHAVVLSSTSDGFCVAASRGADDCDAAADLWASAVTAIGRLRAPTAAVIAGDAVGPAWDLALACDLRIAAHSARMGSPQVRWGRIPSAGATQRLPRLVGLAAATRLLLLGEVVDAAEALRLGLVQRVSPAASLSDGVAEVVADLRRGAPIALAFDVEAVRRARDLALPDGLSLEEDLTVLLQTTRDRAEGLTAFSERRTPRFEGR